ncbi:hypothetical protein P7C73_g1036, partial [Tremellales sp. Uapishka_1]
MPPLTIFLTTYNTGLEGSKAQAQDLAGWLAPVLHDSSADPQLPKGHIPDIYAIAVQELLPLHLALAGLSGSVLLALTARIQNLLSSHATSLSPGGTAEKYILVSRVSHVGVALWVFARESTMAGRLGKALESTLGLWYLGMGNKAAVGVRLPVRRGDGEGGWEILTFVSAHLEAHDHNLERRNRNYHNILSSLLFHSSDPLIATSQIHDTSHLFVMGDLNYRLSELPGGKYPSEGEMTVAIEKERAVMVDLDTLKSEQKKGRTFGGLREGDLTRFAPTYKRIVGKLEGYSKKRIPGYTDRILFASHTDPSDLFSPGSTSAPETTTQITHFNSSPSLLISDHKPVHAILSLPAPTHSAPAPHLAPFLPAAPPPHPLRPSAVSREELVAWKLMGGVVDKSVGLVWSLLVLLGWGNPSAGLGVGAVFAMVWGAWWSGVMSAA